MTTTPTTKKPRKPREKKTRDKTTYSLNIYKDKELKELIKNTIIRPDKKLARRDMMDLASLHLTQGLYYYYEMVEHKLTSIEIYPSNK
jgi:hypothetical protein